MCVCVCWLTQWGGCAQNLELTVRLFLLEKIQGLVLKRSSTSKDKVKVTINTTSHHISWSDQFVRSFSIDFDTLFCFSFFWHFAMFSDFVQAAGVALDDRQKAAEPPLPLLTRVGLKALGRTALLLISTYVCVQGESVVELDVGVSLSLVCGSFFSM
jgi:hypothetical protein